jgi:hypothetical protein
MLENRCSVCGCTEGDMSYAFESELTKLKVGVVCVAEQVLNENIAKVLGGDCVLHSDGEYVTGYTYITDDESELELVDKIAVYLKSEIAKFELK